MEWGDFGDYRFGRLLEIRPGIGRDLEDRLGDAGRRLLRAGDSAQRTCLVR